MDDPSKVASGPSAADCDLAALYAKPYSLYRPRQQTLPIVFASPHSGRVYPKSFVAKSRLGALALRRSEDAFVDELFLPVLDLGAPLLAARFPRAFVDANRAPAELDSAMFDGRLPMSVDASPRVNAGLGVIPRIVRDGAEIYRSKLPPSDAEERLSRLYRPYHAALDMLVDDTCARFGYAIVIDCHSMPSAFSLPDVVLGDRYGIAASSRLVQAADYAFTKHGFSVTRNAPYAGGYTTHLHGRRDGRVQAMQIELNRALYLDEERIEPHSEYMLFSRRLAQVLNLFTHSDFGLEAPQRQSA